MRVRRLFVTPELIATMLTTGYVFGGEIKVVAGLPPEAVLTTIGWDVSRRAWALDFVHPTFELVADACFPPVLEISLQKKSATLTDALTE